jgi:DNA-binding XRE family transcriptional regulator
MREGNGYVVLESRADIMRELDLTEEDMAEAHTYQQARISAYRLGEFRRELGMTQAEVAAAMGVSQRRVSQIERGDLGVTQLDTIRSYISALGGEVEIMARVGSHAKRVA